MAIQWGPIKEVGMAAKLSDNIVQRMESGGIQFQPMISCLHVLGLMLQSDSPVLSSFTPMERSKGQESVADVKLDLIEKVARILGKKTNITLNL